MYMRTCLSVHVFKLWKTNDDNIIKLRLFLIASNVIFFNRQVYNFLSYLYLNINNLHLTLYYALLFFFKYNTIIITTDKLLAFSKCRIIVDKLMTYPSISNYLITKYWIIIKLIIWRNLTSYTFDSWRFKETKLDK